MKQATCDAPAWRRPRDASGKSEPDVANFRPTARRRAWPGTPLLTNYCVIFRAGLRSCEDLAGRKISRAMRRAWRWKIFTSGVRACRGTPLWCAPRATARESRGTEMGTFLVS
jgi:hypothetical protein